MTTHSANEQPPQERRGDERSRRVLLVHPPYSDVTYPYHSLSYVAPPLRAAGYEVDLLDLNALWFRGVFTRSRLRAFRRELLREVEAAERDPSLTMERQEQLVDLLRCAAVASSLDPEAAVETLRSEAFYDPQAYLAAREQVRAFELLLTRLYKPFDFFTAYALPPYEPDASEVVAKALASRRLIDDLAAILRARCAQRDYFLCGVSIPFSAQLVPGMALLQAMGEVFPGARRVAGGTAVSDIFKYRSGDDALRPFAALCDLFYVGEAETGITRMAAWCRGDTAQLPDQAVQVGAGASNLVRLPYVSLADSAAAARGFVPYDWRLHPPDYDWVEWDLYLAPERRINYAPSRGCFWNKCTFCDYGLNTDGPTAPSRTMDAETVVAHLRPLRQRGIRHVYLAVDALAPKFVEAFADRLLAEGLDIHWSCQFFLSKAFTPALVAKLEAAGLRLASFGLESGSSRVLERMGKGSRRVEEVLEPALAAFRASSIGLQPLYFFGFPGEDDEDCQLTVDLLLRHADVFSTITKGGLFDLLPGSMLARDPERYGLRNIRRREGDTIAGGLEYCLASDQAPPSCISYQRFNDQLPHSSLFERPWAGGIDTFHSQLYVERHGRDAFQRLRALQQQRQGLWAEVALRSRFDLEGALQNVVIDQALRSPEGRLTLREALRDGFEARLEAVRTPLERQDRPRRYEIRFRAYQEI